MNKSLKQVANYLPRNSTARDRDFEIVRDPHPQIFVPYNTQLAIKFKLIPKDPPHVFSRL